MRLKYPHIAIGAVSASAPILQFEDIVPTDTFYRIVSEDFKRESTSCFNYIRDSWDVIDKVASENDGLHNLSTVFHMCRDLTGSSELQNWLSAAYSYLGMVDYPFPANFIMPLPAYPIKEVCRAIDALPEGTDILSRIFAGASIYYNFTGQVACFQPDDSGNVDLGTRGWDWQACTEMVMPMSSNPNNSMFPPYNWDLGAFEQWCMETFHVKPRSTWITTEYGGKDIKAVLKNFGSNIVFSNGLLDPWSGGG
jgi:lysosomal Pro-X carboxypeptidase